MIVRRAVAILILLAMGELCTPASAIDRFLASGHVPQIAKKVPVAGDVPSGKRLKLSIGLPLRNQDRLNQLIADLYNPACGNFHHFLGPDEFAGQFAPTAEAYEAVAGFARSNHLVITRRHANRMLIEVEGAAEEIGNTFHVRLKNFHRPGGKGTFFAPNQEPSAPSELSILDVSGLSDYQLPRPMVSVRAQNSLHENARANLGSSSGGGYMGNDFRSAYVPGTTLTGTGQSVGLVEFDGYYGVDITNYEIQAGLGAVPLKTILLDGYNGTPTSGGNTEVSLDIEMAISMAPGLSNVYVYEAGPSGNPNDVLNRMATDNKAKQLSCSWAWTGGPSATTDQIFQQMAVQGQSFFCASGDSDAYATGTLDNSSFAFTPSDSPYVTCVGGTELNTTGPGGARLSESVWNWGNGQGSSGGISTFYAIPSWQATVNMSANGGSSTMRNIPDVAMAADNIFVTYGNGSSGIFGGTSCAAPLWTAFTALVNQQAVHGGLSPVGFLNPAIYNAGMGSNYGSVLNDITAGNNINAASPAAFYATSGYDLCTGWGTPNGTNLINVLAPPPNTFAVYPTNGFAITGLVGGPFSVNTGNFSLTNLGTSTICWTVGNSAAWLTASTNGGTLSPNGTAAVTFTLNAAANSLAPGAYNGTVWLTNMLTGSVVSRQVTLTVATQMVLNGDFEAVSLTNWTQSGNTVYTFASTANTYVHSGTYGLQAGPSGTAGHLAQTLSTVAGQNYVLSLWLENPKPGGSPNQFGVSWNGANIFSQTNMPIFSWTNLQFIVPATSTATPLQFTFRNDPGYFGMDDVSVVPLATPTVRSMVMAQNTMQLSLSTTAGLKYQLQYITDLTQTNWMNIGPPFTATTSLTTFSDTNAVDPQRFYRVTVFP